MKAIVRPLAWLTLLMFATDTLAALRIESAHQWLPITPTGSCCVSNPPPLAMAVKMTQAVVAAGAVSATGSPLLAGPMATYLPLAGTHRVLVLRIDFSDRPGEPFEVRPTGPLTASRALALVRDQVGFFYHNASFGKYQFNEVVVPTNIIRNHHNPRHYSALECLRHRFSAAGLPVAA
jgi:hypothetical protein